MDETALQKLPEFAAVQAKLSLFTARLAAQAPDLLGQKKWRCMSHRQV